MKHRFWMSAGAITLTQDQVSAMSEEEAWLLFAEMRWGNRETQLCPECKIVDSHYRIRTRKQWRCKDCNHTFSATSGTPFHGHKLSYRALMVMVCAFVINHKGIPALAVRRVLGVNYTTAFLQMHKIRTAIMNTASEEKLSGVVEVDGAHFSGRLRKGRKKKKPAAEKAVPNKYATQHRRKEPASAYAFHPNRRIVMVLREIDPEKIEITRKGERVSVGLGARRTIVDVCYTENKQDAEALIKKHVAPHSVIRTDELYAYKNLRKLKSFDYGHEVVNHSREFSSDKGYNQNQAESFFARMRRSNIGVYHRIGPKYMKDYGREMAWREDHRRLDVKTQMATLIARVANSGRSRDWINYCRGNHRPGEQVFQASTALAPV